MAQLELQLGLTIQTVDGRYRIIADTKPAGRDYQDGDTRTIHYLSGSLKGRKIVQEFQGDSASGGWYDID